jgi:tetratricopeptide (TPR) repeat protein/TolB-like protein
LELWILAVACCILNVALCIASAHAQSLVPVGATQLVMPFENASREARYNWLSEGVSLALTDDLVALGADALSRDDRLRAFERLRVPAVATLSEATIIRIGQIVGAEQIVVGSFTVANGMFTIQARAIRLDTGRRFPEIVQTGALTDFFDLCAAVARRLLPDSTVSSVDLERGRPPLAAFEEFVKGSLAENPATQVVFLKEALRYAPDYHRARLALWSAYTDQAAHSQALEVARQVPAASPLAREARFDAALSLVQLGRHAEAIGELVALNREKRDAALLNDAGVAQLRRTAASPDGSSADFFRQAVAADPSDPDLAFNLGYASWLAHDTVNAITSLREAVRRNPADDAAHWVLGVALEASSNAAEGEREKELARRLSSRYAEWDRRQPGTRAIPPNLERLKTELDAGASSRVNAAIAAAEQRDQRDTATFHLASARRLYEVHRDGDAIGELRRAIYLSPYDRDAHLLLGRLYLRSGRIADAIDELKISIWSEDRTDARVALAEAYIAAKNPEAARTEIQTILTREPSNAAAIALREEIEVLH